MCAGILRQVLYGLVGIALRSILRTCLEWQEAAELPGKATDGLTETLVAKPSANGAAKRRTDLTEQIAEEALRRELSAGILWQILSGWVGIGLRRGVEWQEATELPGNATDGLTEALMSKPSANGAAERRSDLTEQIAEEALRRELRGGIERQIASELLRDIADRLAETLVAERATNRAAKLSGILPEPVSDRALRRELRGSIERQIASELLRDIADRLAETLITEGATNRAAQLSGILSEPVSDCALWCELRGGVEW